MTALVWRPSSWTTRLRSWACKRRPSIKTCTSGANTSVRWRRLETQSQYSFINGLTQDACNGYKTQICTICVFLSMILLNHLQEP